MTDSTAPPSPTGAAGGRDEEAIARDVRAGMSLRATGAKHGLSHEAVRTIVRRVDPDAIVAGQVVRANAKRAAAEQTAPGPETYEKVCPVCGTTFTTTDERRVTDKTSCARAWAKGVRHQSPERMARHQDNVARSTLRHPDKYPGWKVAWAQRRADERGLLKEAS